MRKVIFLREILTDFNLLFDVKSIKNEKKGPKKNILIKENSLVNKK